MKKHFKKMGIIENTGKRTTYMEHGVETAQKLLKGKKCKLALFNERT